MEGGGGGTSSEGDISSINEEDEESETPPPVGNSALTGQETGPNAGTEQGPESVTVTKGGVLVDQPPGSELNKATFSQPQSEGLEGGQPLSRKDSDAYSDISSSALSEAETDIDTREAYITSQGRSESPQYTPGAGPSGHYYLHHSHHHPNNYPGYLNEENNEGVRSGEVTPRRGHSPPSSPGGGVNEKAYNGKHHQHHWTPQVADLHTSGSGSTPGSGANTPRRRMSLGDMSSFSNANNQQGYPHHHSQKGTSVFGFDEAQLKNRLGQMDLNSRRRKPITHEQDENENENDNQEDDEDEVPMPVDSKQVRGAGLELAV